MGRLGALWGLTGVSLILGWAIYRLTLIGLAGWDVAWGPVHWAAFAVWMLIMAVGKGYFALHRGWSPRMAARIRYLDEYPDLLRVALAPLFCLGFFHAPRKRILISLGMVAVMIGLVLSVSGLDQPWRGIIDLGVSAGLTWGLVAMWGFTFLAFTDPDFSRSPEVA